MKPFLISLLICAALICGGCSNAKDDTTETVPVRPVRYMVLETQTQTLNQSFSGTAAANREAVLSFKVSGTVKTIPVKVGDRVRAGDLLAQLDETDLTVDLESARAGLKASQADAKSAQTNVYTTRSNYDRIQNLYENDNVSLSEFEQARGNYETAQAQLQAANSRITTETTKLRAAENQLRYTRLTAPFDGIVNNLAIEENEEITPGSAVLTLSGLGKLDVKVDVSDLHIGGIQAGMPCKISFPALDHETFDGRVTEVSYGATEAPTYPVTVGVLSQDIRLRPGMAAEVIFDFGKAGTEAGIYLPPDGVGEDSGGNFVFVIEKGADGTATARKRKVVIGPLTGKGFLAKEGVAAKDLIATSGLQLLLDGMAVKLLDDPINQW